MARELGGRLLLRIEDIDAERCRPEYEAVIHEDLAWLGISWQQPIRRQSEHLAERIQKLAAAPAEQIDRLFQIVLLREPTSEELGRWLGYAEKHGLANACRMMFNTNEFMFIP